MEGGVTRGRCAPPDRVARRIVRAVVRGRRRVVTGPLNDLGLRVVGALPELGAAFLSVVGKRVLRRAPAEAKAPRGAG